MYSSPNWVFDNVLKQNPFLNTVSFHAITSDEFVSEFARLATKDVAALIIVDPSNPLGFRLDQKQVETVFLLPPSPSHKKRL